jgi:6-phosphogluconolactonase (cycloisomerase 2 family)
MKFKKFGKALLLSALSAGIVLGVTSCAQSYTVGYLYVTGTDTSNPGAGFVSGFRIDHNTGKLTSINGMPVSSGGDNPVRAVLLDGRTFLYVLNRGTNPTTGSICTTDHPCSNYNITQFSVGANGSLTAQQVYCAIQTGGCTKPILQGINPTRLIADSTGTHLYVLDHDSVGADGKTPATASNPNTNCAVALSTTTCGDITAFSVDSTTGLLSLIQNSGTVVNGQDLTYFPVPSNPVDFTISGGYIFTLYATTNAGVDSTTGAYTGGSWVFPYTYTSTSGLLTTASSGIANLGISEGTAIVTGGSYIYVLDNEAPSTNPTGASSQILAYTVSSGGTGALQLANNGVIADDVSASDPVYLTVDSTNKWFYVINDAPAAPNKGLADSDIAGYVINTTYDPTEISGSPFGTGSGPQCLVEDPSNQFFYEANFVSQNVTGQKLDNNAGVLAPFSQSYTLKGPATWCLVDGRTD